VKEYIVFAWLMFLSLVHGPLETPYLLFTAIGWACGDLLYKLLVKRD